MIETQIDSTSAGSKSYRSVGNLETRIDGPHPMRLAPVAEEHSSVVPHASLADDSFQQESASADNPRQWRSAMAECSAELLEQVRTQAQQLAAHLRARQADLDRREAELHTRLAELDNGWRDARLWLNEQRGDLLQRAETLDHQQQQCEERLAQVAEAEQQRAELDQELAQRQSALDVQSQQLSGQQIAQQKTLLRFRRFRQRTEMELRRQRQEIEAQRAGALELVRQLMLNVERRRRSVETEAAEAERMYRLQRAELQAQVEELKPMRDDFARRQQNLATAEALLNHDRQHLEQAQAQLTSERSRFEAEQAADREKLLAEQTQWSDELAAQRKALHERSTQLDAQRTSLEQLQGELRQAHREVLENRLATEELWAELSETAPTSAS